MSYKGRNQVMSRRHLTTKGHFRLAAGSFYFIQGFVFVAWMSRIPDIKLALALSDSKLGMILLAMPAGQMIAMALSAFLIRRFGSNRMVKIAAFLLAFFLIPLALAPSFWILLFLLFIFGMISNLSNIAIGTQCVQVERLYRKSIMVSFHGVWSLAGLVGLFLSMAMSIGKVAIFWHFVIVILVIQVVYWSNVFRLMPRDLKSFANRGKTDEKTSDYQGAKLPLLGRIVRKCINVEPYLLFLGIIGFGCLAAEGAMYNWSGVYFADVLHLKNALILLGYIGYMVAVTFCRFSADFVVRRWGYSKVIMTAGWLILAGSALLTIRPGLVVCTFGCIVIGLGTAAIIPITYSLAGNSKKIPPQSGIAIISTISYLGFLLSPPVIGIVADMTSLRFSMAGIGLFSFLTTLLIKKINREH